MTEQNVTIKANGPYLVAGSVPLVRRRPIETEHGEPIAWSNPEPVDDGVAYALCRCGGSGNKPFCDGTHASNGFDGTETAPTDDYASRASELGGTGITVYDDRGICAHAGFCGNQATNIWEMVDSTDDTQVRSQVVAMVERCPSGALSCEIDGSRVEPDLPRQVTVITDGPLWVNGGIPVTRSDGEPLQTRNRATLCRCGQSANKPLCDGSHHEAGFRG